MTSMKFAIDVPNCGGFFADVRLVAEMAHEAEAAGWDGFFVWDHISDKWAPEVVDPWVLLSAIAMRTEHVKIGTMVTPLPRRRPWKVSREVVTLDQLSGGRVILGVGIGGGAEYTDYHESGDDRMHAEMLDEGLELLQLLWSGERISYKGQHYQLDNILYLPRPVQQPRIPIWVAGVWPNKKPMQRAAQWDGVFPIGKGLSASEQLSPSAMHECLDYVRSLRAQGSPAEAAEPFALVHYGLLERKDEAKDVAVVEEYAAVGVNWWVENVTWKSGSLQEIRERIRKGPPSLS